MNSDANDSAQRNQAERMKMTAKDSGEFGFVPDITSGTVRVVIERNPAALPAFWPRTTTTTPGRYWVFQCADVIEAWCASLGMAQGIESLFVAVLDARDQPLLLLPLGIRSRGGVRQLVFLDETVSDYNAPVVFAGARDFDAATMRRVWHDIVASLPPFDVAVLEKMPDMVKDWPNPMRFLATGPSCVGAHGMTLPADWESDGKKRLPNFRDSRRRLRKLAERGAVSIETAQTAEEASAILEAMISMKRRQLLRITGVDPFDAHPGYVDYYVEATRRLFAGGAVHLSALRLDDQILAAHWGYVLDDRFYQLMPTFLEDEEWRFYAPGRLLNEHLIEWSTRQGLAIFDFGCGDEPYKAAYCDQHWSLNEAVLPMTAIGQLWSLAFNARRFAADRLREFATWNTIKAFRHRLRSRRPAGWPAS